MSLRERRFWTPTGLAAALILTAIFLAWCLLPFPAQGQDGHWQGHGRHHESYKTWCQPGHGPKCATGYSCCDARTVGSDEWGNPQIQGHCYPTEFRPNPSGKTTWIAKLAPEDVEVFGVEWIEVPDEKEVRYKNPDQTGQDGHLCTNIYTKVILCSRPPTGSL